MKIPDLESFYHDELKDAYDFEHQILEALPEMADAANDPELRKAFEDHLEQTEGQVGRLERVFELHGWKAERKHCDGIEGLLEEGEEVLEAEGDEDAIDAALIAAAQRVEHYEMAAYGTLRTYARTLGQKQAAELLQQTLDEEADADGLLTRLAEGGVNRRAAEADGGRQAGRGRAQGSRAARGSSRGPRKGAGEKTKDELYEEAQRLGVEGRSQMDKKQLARAVKKKAS